jgi:hypothetical protein
MDELSFFRKTKNMVQPASGIIVFLQLQALILCHRHKFCIFLTPVPFIRLIILFTLIHFFFDLFFKVSIYSCCKSVTQLYKHHLRNL